MSNLFSNVQVYAGKWNLKSSVALDADDKALFSSAKVVDSKYGMSVCFFFKAGGQAYIPVSTYSAEVHVGDSVNLDKVEIETLCKDGEADIMRVKVLE